MSRGRLRCLGTPQHLKSKYGDGYVLELRASLTAKSADLVTEQIVELFPVLHLDLSQLHAHAHSSLGMIASECASLWS